MLRAEMVVRGVDAIADRMAGAGQRRDQVLDGFRGGRRSPLQVTDGRAEDLVQRPLLALGHDAEEVVGRRTSAAKEVQVRAERWRPGVDAAAEPAVGAAELGV